MIFVFGSNLAGRHGKGAAYHAHKVYGAELGVGEGRTGNAYAIPTKDHRLRSRTWVEVTESIDRFLDHAWRHDQVPFLLTPIGCGLAGFKAGQVWAYLKHRGLPYNVMLAPQWVNDHNIIKADSA